MARPRAHGPPSQLSRSLRAWYATHRSRSRRLMDRLVGPPFVRLSFSLSLSRTGPGLHTVHAACHYRPLLVVFIFAPLDVVIFIALALAFALPYNTKRTRPVSYLILISISTLSTQSPICIIASTRPSQPMPMPTAPVCTQSVPMCIPCSMLDARSSQLEARSLAAPPNSNTQIQGATPP